MILRKIRKYISFKVRALSRAYYRLMGVRVGQNVYISTGAWLDIAAGKLVIEDNVIITKGCKILSHDWAARRHNKNISMEQETRICKDVFLGMNVIVLPGVTIGEGSVIGSGCVVSKDVPPFSILVSAKPRIIRQKNLETNEWERVNTEY